VSGVCRIDQANLSHDSVAGMVNTECEAFREMKARLADLLPRLNERDRRIALAVEANSWGWGGISAVHEVTGVSRSTIQRGKAELAEGPAQQPEGRIRAPGGGRKRVEVTDPGLVPALDTLIEPESRGIRNRRCGGPQNLPVVWLSS
jgi:hypothetical protein